MAIASRKRPQRQYLYDDGATPTEIFSETEIRRLFDAHLDKQYAPISIGQHTFQASHILARLDIILYVRLFDNWLEEHHWRELPYQ